MRRIRSLGLQVVMLAGLAMASLGLAVSDQEKAAEIGTSSCADCHEDMVEKMAATIHGRLGRHELDPERMCEACHGPGSIHGDSEGETPIARRFQDDTVEYDVANACATCHVGGGTLGWPASAHAAGGILCIECHDVKAPYQNRSPSAQAELCAGCHSEMRAIFDMPSHHPLREGKMACSDCHNPHSAELRLPGAQVCGQCHDSERFATAAHAGHEPGQADCLDCHMMQRTYMQVDDRRDHSFRIPRPALADRHGAPNACTNCHQGRSAEWAAAALAADDAGMHWTQLLAATATDRPDALRDISSPRNPPMKSSVPSIMLVKPI